ncbi:hypothetical protein D3C80_1620710 [compost metagenome]
MILQFLRDEDFDLFQGLEPEPNVVAQVVHLDVETGLDGGDDVDGHQAVEALANEVAKAVAWVEGVDLIAKQLRQGLANTLLVGHEAVVPCGVPALISVLPAL